MPGNDGLLDHTGKHLFIPRYSQPFCLARR